MDFNGQLPCNYFYSLHPTPLPSSSPPPLNLDISPPFYQSATPADSISVSSHPLSYQSPSFLLAENIQLRYDEELSLISMAAQGSCLPNDLDYQLYPTGFGELLPQPQQEAGNLRLFPDESSLTRPVTPVAASSSTPRPAAKRFQCDRCHRGFTKMYSLKRHKKVLAEKGKQCNAPDKYGYTNFAAHRGDHPQ